MKKVVELFPGVVEDKLDSVHQRTNTVPKLNGDFVFTVGFCVGLVN